MSGEDANLQSFLVCDKVIISEVNDIPFALMSAFLFSIYVTLEDVITYFHLWRFLTLNYPSNKASATVKHFLSSLYN